ncbi:MAG: hypothetical protein ACK4M0_13730 [Phreatobacter sp.]
MSLAERNESAVRAWPRAMPIDTMAGPMAAAAIVPAAVMMAGLVTAWGIGLGLANTLVAIRRQGAPAAANDPARSQGETLPRLAVVAGPARAAPTTTAPKPARPVGAAPKSAAAAPASARPAPTRRKATPAVTVAPAAPDTITTARGISLPRLSIQDAKPDDPAEA